MSETNAISQLIQSKLTAEKNYFTHVSLHPRRGKLQIDRNGQEEMFELFKKSPADLELGIAERPIDYLPIIVDVDIKLKSASELFPLYTNQDVLKIISIYQSVIRELSIPDFTEEMLNCIYLSKEPYLDKGVLKHGFHLHFPYIFAHISVHKLSILPKVVELVSTTLFSSTNINENSIDTNYCKNMWLMYGCSKNEGRRPYLISNVYDSSQEEISFNGAFKNYEIFNARGDSILMDEPINYIHRILSIIPNGRKCCEIYVKEIEKEAYKKQHFKSFNDTGDLKFAGELLELISSVRADDRTDWMRIGWALYNISDGSGEGLEMWISFSKKSEKFDESKCIYEWDKMNKGTLTIGTLRRFATIDSPEKYEELCARRMVVRKNRSFTHVQLALLLYENFAGEIVCSGLTPQETWHVFEDGIWKKSERGRIIMNKITTYLVPLFLKIKGELYQNVKDAREELVNIEKDTGMASIEYGYQLQKLMDLDEEIKQNSKNIQMLETRPFRSNIRGECSELFYDGEFLSKLNANIYLFAFKNGVYDFQINQFRKGLPEDYISKMAGVDYIQNINEYDEYISKMNDYLFKVFIDDDVRRYFMDYCCEFFVGGNQNKIFMIFSGYMGDNAKSMTIKILETIFKKDSYYVNLPIQVILGKRAGSGCANPDLARCGDGVRIVVTQEPGSGTSEQINVGLMKELTGNDSFFARFLFENGRDVTPMFKFIMVCNIPPKISGIDNASRERIRIIPFESRFVKAEDAPENFDEQVRTRTFPRDPYFGNHAADLAAVFAWMLIQHRVEKVNAGRGDVVPEKVKLASKAYSDKNDIYRTFFMTYIEKKEECNLPLDIAYDVFTEWYESSFRGRRLIDKYDFADLMCLYVGNHEDYLWPGYALKPVANQLKNPSLLF